MNYIKKLDAVKYYIARCVHFIIVYIVYVTLKQALQRVNCTKLIATQLKQTKHMLCNFGSYFICRGGSFQKILKTYVMYYIIPSIPNFYNAPFLVELHNHILLSDNTICHAITHPPSILILFYSS